MATEGKWRGGAGALTCLVKGLINGVVNANYVGFNSPATAGEVRGGVSGVRKKMTWRGVAWQ